MKRASVEPSAKIKTRMGEDEHRVPKLPFINDTFLRITHSFETVKSEISIEHEPITEELFANNSSQDDFKEHHICKADRFPSMLSYESLACDELKTIKEEENSDLSDSAVEASPEREQKGRSSNSFIIPIDSRQIKSKRYFNDSFESNNLYPMKSQSKKDSLALSDVIQKKSCGEEACLASTDFHVKECSSFSIVLDIAANASEDVDLPLYDQRQSNELLSSLREFQEEHIHEKNEVTSKPCYQVTQDDGCPNSANPICRIDNVVSLSSGTAVKGQRLPSDFLNTEGTVIVDNDTRVPDNSEASTDDSACKTKIERHVSRTGKVRRAAYRNGYIVLDKHQYCYFCKKPKLELRHHILNAHKDNASVQELLSVKSKDKKLYLKELKRLRHLGNYIHYIDTVMEGRPDIVVVRRPSAGRKISEYEPCRYCYGFYNVADLHRHVRKCVHRKLDGDVPCGEDVCNGRKSTSEGERGRRKPRVQSALKSGWSNEEIDVLREKFGDFIKKGTYPAGQQIQQVIRENECLKMRTRVHVRSKLQHLMRKL